MAPAGVLLRNYSSSHHKMGMQQTVLLPYTTILISFPSSSPAKRKSKRNLIFLGRQTVTLPWKLTIGNKGNKSAIYIRMEIAYVVFVVAWAPSLLDALRFSDRLAPDEGDEALPAVRRRGFSMACGRSRKPAARLQVVDFSGRRMGHTSHPVCTPPSRFLSKVLVLDLAFTEHQHSSWMRQKG